MLRGLGCGGSVGDAYKSMGRCLFHNVCGFPVSWDASVDVCSEEHVLRLLSLAHHLFCFITFGLQ